VTRLVHGAAGLEAATAATTAVFGDVDLRSTPGLAAVHVAHAG
jgi:hypothetical protein